jgi:hypothetical protein
MTRTVKTTRVGDKTVRYRVRIEDDLQENMVLAQRAFLDHLAMNQELLTCGYHRFQKLTIFRGNGRWVAEAEATVDEDE